MVDACCPMRGLGAGVRGRETAVPVMGLQGLAGFHPGALKLLEVFREGCDEELCGRQECILRRRVRCWRTGPCAG